MADILHIDMNAFFASVEEVLHPEITDKPVIIGSTSKRGVVSTANYKARGYGVNAAMPMYKALQLCPHAIVFDVNFPAYEKFHHDFMTVVREFSDKVEVASIDECFVNIDNLTTTFSPKIIATRIQRRIKERTGLGCSIGIGHNKFMAKMGSDYRKPMGITQMYETDLINKLWPLDIGQMYMVGKSTATLLRRHDINVIGDLVHISRVKLCKILGKVGLRLYENARGLGDEEVIAEVALPKSISLGETFLNNTDDPELIVEKINDFSKQISKRLNVYNLEAKLIQLSVKFPDFKIKNKSQKIDHFFTDCETIIFYAKTMFEKYFFQQEIRALTIHVGHLQKRNENRTIFS